ncbi:MAG: hypothetical protein J7K72_01850, partial [Candidatus Aenigmarchaeota archaeon]|nr:hypothetical protein [Candidatus Aenigmarchaeota archaeon]
SGVNYVRSLKNQKIEKGIECFVRDFYLPERFGGLTGTAKEYINAFGDPSFLVYYQSFPIGEDKDWRSESEWFTGVGKAMFIAMCITDIIRFKAIVGQNIKDIVKKTIGKVKKISVFKNIGTAEKVTATQLFPRLAEKVYGEEILATIEKWSLNKGIVDFFKGKYKTSSYALKEIKASLEAAGKKFSQGEWEVLQKGFMKAWRGEYSSVDLSKLLVDKAEPGLMKKLMKKTIEKAKSRDTLIRAAKYAGVDYGISYYLARFDSEIGKFIKEHPNSLVLGMPLKKEDVSQLSENEIPKNPVRYPESQNLVPLGKPVILIKKEWGNQPVPFYLASPCKAHLTVESKPMKCGLYTYDSTTGMTTCDNPDKKTVNNWWKRLWGSDKEIPMCGSLIKGDNERMFDSFKEAAVDTVEYMGDSKVYSGEVEIKYEDKPVAVKRVKIVDPIDNIEFYYDKKNKVIDGIGATIKVGDVYERRVYSVEHYLKEAENNGGIINHFIKSDDDKKYIKFYSYSKWKGYVVTTEDNTVGFACREHEIGKYGEFENSYEKFVMGEWEIPSGNKYLTCKGPFIEDGYYHTYHDMLSIYFDSKTGNFYGMMIGKKKTLPISPYVSEIYYFVFKDSNHDGKVDEFGEYYLSLKQEPDIELSKKYPNIYFQQRVFMDRNFDGETDSVVSTNCKIPEAVVVEVDKIGEDEYGNNYCYQTESGAWNVITTVALFGTSALAKSGEGALLAMAVDCGIAAAELVGVGQSKWPSG